MKNTKLSLLLSFVLMAFMWQSCNYIDPDINIDPNKAADVSPDLLLPAAQVTLGYTLGGDVGRFTSIWTQQHAGSERQHTAYDVYQLKEADVNTAWSNFYSAALKDLDGVLEKTSESSPHYAGVAKVMKAFIFSQIVDLWDAVPYSQALAGAENLAPGYDSGADIYAALQVMLTDAIADLGAAQSVLSPGGDDLIHGGDLSAWIATANTLSARLHLHLSASNGATAYSEALKAIDNGGIASNGGNAVVPFANTSPWFQFDTDRGDVNIGAFIVDLMNAQDDPRRAVYFAANEDGEYVGASAGMPNNSPGISRFGSLYGSTSSSVPLITYHEAKFIEAEAAMATDAARAAAAYNEALTASVAYCGVDGTDFLTANAAETETSITMEKIMTQKYIALYSQPEVFTDWRRTGMPALAPANGETAIARRFPYPSSERLYNVANYVSGVTNFDRVFWDAQ